MLFSVPHDEHCFEQAEGWLGSLNTAPLKVCKAQIMRSSEFE